MMTETKNRFAAEIEVQVPFFDLDPMAVVWHGHYVKYLEMARCELLGAIDYNYGRMKESGYVWPVIDMALRYISPARFCQKIRVSATIVEWENRLKIDYRITDAATGQRLTKAFTTQVAVDIATGQLCFVSPSILFEKLGVSAP